MTNGKFYSVGVGPGDPALLTLKAISTIQKSDIIAVPKSGAKESIALCIASDYVIGKQIVQCNMPMTKDKQKLENYHQLATNQMEIFLNQGKIISFLTLGDPSIYSTTMYIHKRLSKKGYETEIIPGVPSFCAVAAALNTSLCESDETLHIIPSSYADSEQSVDLEGNKIFMKAGKNLDNLINKISNKNYDVMIVECASMENEKIYNLQNINEQTSYFSTVVVKKL